MVAHHQRRRCSHSFHCEFWTAVDFRLDLQFCRRAISLEIIRGRFLTPSCEVTFWKAAMPATAVFAGCPPAQCKDLRRSELSRAARSTHDTRLPEHPSFTRQRRHPFRFAMADGQRPKLSWLFRRMGRGSVCSHERLRKQWHGQEMVGILLPPSVPGALVNYAAMYNGHRCR